MSSILPIHSDAMYSAKADEVYDWFRLEAPTVLRNVAGANVSVEPDDGRRVVVLRVDSGKNQAVLTFAVSDASTDEGAPITRVVTDVAMPNARTGFFANQSAQSRTLGMFIALDELFGQQFPALPRG